MSNVISKAEFDFNEKDVTLTIEEENGRYAVIVKVDQNSTQVFAGQDLGQVADVFYAIVGAYKALDVDC